MHWLKGRPLMDIDKLVECFRGRLALDVQQFGRTDTKVFIAVTNCRTASADYLRLTPDNALDVLQATMALPLAYGRVVNIHGQPYIDGGVVDCIPLERALERDFEHIVVVLTQPEGYRKHRSRLAEAMLRAQYARYPELPGAFRERSARYNAHLDQIAALEREGKVSVIRPAERLPASRMTRDRRRILDTIQLGRDCARNWFDSPKFELA
jgi:predicted patatin/cPLA2 family phospholipase